MPRKATENAARRYGRRVRVRFDLLPDARHRVRRAHDGIETRRDISSRIRAERRVIRRVVGSAGRRRLRALRRLKELGLELERGELRVGVN